MTDLPIILLAHGHQERLLDLSIPKQFLQVAGEPIVVRTIRLLRELGAEPHLVVAPEREEWTSLGAKILSIQGELPSIVTLAGELLLLKGGALFLLADVAFSRQALATILQDRSPLAFFGKPGPNPWTKKSYDETYAFRCSSESVSTVLAALSHQHPSIPWKLRDLRVHFGLPHVEIPDWTDDVDTDYDLVHVLPILDAQARSEPHP